MSIIRFGHISLHESTIDPGQYTYVYLDYSTRFPSITNNWAFECMIEPTGLAGNQRTLFSVAGRSIDPGCRLYIDNGVLKFETFCDTSSATVAADTLLVDGQIYHIAIRATPGAYTFSIDTPLGGNIETKVCSQTYWTGGSDDYCDCWLFADALSGDWFYTGKVYYMRLWTPTGLATGNFVSDYNWQIIPAWETSWGAQWWTSPQNWYLWDSHMDTTNALNDWAYVDILGVSYHTFTFYSEPERSGAHIAIPPYLPDPTYHGHFDGPIDGMSWHAADGNLCGYGTFYNTKDGFIAGTADLSDAYPQNLFDSVDYTGIEIYRSSPDPDLGRYGLALSPPSGIDVNATLVACWMHVLPGTYEDVMTWQSGLTDPNYREYTEDIYVVYVNDVEALRGTPEELGWMTYINGAWERTGSEQARFNLCNYTPPWNIRCEKWWWCTEEWQDCQLSYMDICAVSTIPSPVDSLGNFISVTGENMIYTDKKNNANGFPLPFDLRDASDVTQCYSLTDNSIPLPKLILETQATEGGAWTIAESTNTVVEHSSGGTNTGTYVLQLTQAETNNFCVKARIATSTSYIMAPVTVYFTEGYETSHAIGANTQSVTVQTTGSAPIAGAKVWAQDGTGAVVASTDEVTDASGAVTLYHDLADSTSVYVYAVCSGYEAITGTQVQINTNYGTGASGGEWILSMTAASTSDVTLDDLVTYFRIRMRDIPAAQWSVDSYVYQLAARAYEQTCLRAKLGASTSTTISLVEGTANYSIDPLYMVSMVTLDGESLKRTTYADAELNNIDNFSTNGTPTHYLVTGGQHIDLLPAPDATAAAKTCIAYGYGLGTRLTTGSATPSLLPRGFEYIPVELMIVHALDVPERPPHWENMAQRCLAAWEQQVQKLCEIIDQEAAR